jgi:hypothetical protein
MPSVTIQGIPITAGTGELEDLIPVLEKLVAGTRGVDVKPKEVFVHLPDDRVTRGRGEKISVTICDFENEPRMNSHIRRELSKRIKAKLSSHFSDAVIKVSFPSSN